MYLDKTTKTLVVPTYTLSTELEEMALECVKSHRDQVDQVIISEDGGRYSKKLRSCADIYIYTKKNEGFTKNVNKAWKMSTSDYTLIVNSDAYLESGNLVDLCTTPNVTCPYVEGDTTTSGFTGTYFVVPKETLGKYGMLDERLRTFGSDGDYFERIRHLFRKEGRVKIGHHGSQTLKEAKMDIKEESNLDSLKYRDIITEDYPERITW